MGSSLAETPLITAKAQRTQSAAEEPEVPAGARRYLCRHLRVLCVLCASALKLFLLALTPTGPAIGEEIRVLVQTSPLAGSQYHALAAVAAKMRVGDLLTLVREPANPHDANAVRVDWQGQTLGYVPRAENRALAAAIDRGERVAGRVKRLREHRDPWRRLEFEVFVVL